MKKNFKENKENFMILISLFLSGRGLPLASEPQGG